MRLIMLFALITVAFAGHGDFVDEYICQLCPETAYCVDGQSYPCPDFSLSDPTQFPSTIDECICLGGRHRVGDECQEGQPPFYYIDGDQLSCPQNMLTTSPLASLSTACECDIGFELQGGVCVKCDFGQFKGVTGNQSCVNCDAGFHANQTGMSSCDMCSVNEFSLSGDKDCTACKDFSQSPPGSDEFSDCKCNAGYSDEGVVCEACIAGKYKNTVENEDCFDCPAFSYSQSTSVDITDCKCNAGFTGPNGGTCVACLLGEFKGETGDAACEDCPEDTFANTTGSVFCYDCQNHSTAPARSDHIEDCECNVGHARIGSELEPICSSCEPGKKALSTGCVNCSVSEFSTEYGLTECQPCPANTSAYLFPRTSCQCDPGFRCREGSECHGDCIFCPENTFADTGAWREECSPCQLNSVSVEGSPTQDNCQCIPGFIEAAPHVCEPCLPGSYSSGFDDQSCITCAGDYVYTPVHPITSQDGCLNCSLCPDDQYDAAPCQGALPPNCQFCPANSGTWQSATASNPNIGQQSCSCDANFFGDLGGPCYECQLPKTRSDGNIAQATDISNCLCPMGMFHVNDTACQVCAVATYKSEVSNAESCSSCADTFTTSGTQSISITSCMCPAGTRLQQDTCVACAEDTYKTGINNVTQCTPCRLNSVSNASSTKISDCKCIPGWTLVGDFCEPCQPGTIKSFIGDEACSVCPIDTFEAETQSTKTECDPCPANQTTDNLVQSSACVCVEGLEFTYQCNTSSWLDVHTHCGGCEVLVGAVGSAGFHTKYGTCQAYCESHGRTCTGAKGRLKAYSLPNDGSDVCDPHNWPEHSGGEVMEMDCSSQKQGYYRVCECSDGEGTCGPCPEGEYRSDPSQTTCRPCQECRSSNYFLDQDCTSTSNTVCTGCPSNTNLPSGDVTSRECHCNAGYEMIADTCTQCQSGKYKATDSNNSIPCVTCEAGKRALNPGAAVCDPCDPNCPGAEYVSEECTPTSRIVCEPCTVCEPGNYSRAEDGSTDDTTCGIHFNNDRSDTVCHVCEETYYCHGSVRHYCGANSTSVSGSNSEADCSCVPGFYREDSECKVCGQNHFCINGEQLACPNNSLNHYPQGSDITDCNCLHGYYRTDMNETFFTCNVCLPDDFCFDNSAYDCPDSLQKSVAGSSELAACICIDGYENSVENTTCLPCKENVYCYDGVLYNCSSDRWTQYLQLQDEPSDCVCLPGTFDNAGECEVCVEGSYCPGDDTAYLCPQDSISLAGSKKLYDCECKMGFQSIGFPALACQACSAGYTWKDFVGNLPCEQCRVCSAAEDQVYEKVACTPTHNAVCDACDPCQLGVSYIYSACQDKQNTVCNPCSNCSYDTEWRRHGCLISSNTVCDDINFDVTSCAHGEYRGRHTEISDSFCSICSYLDTKFLSQTLHEPKSFGLTYNDPYSCRVRCLGFSHLRDPGNHSLGCVSCETGNVLLKHFAVETNAEGDQVSCSFTCKSGFDRITRGDGSEDCVTPALSASDANNAAHSLVISDFVRLTTGYQFLVSHSNHSRFVIVVGPSKIGNCNVVRGCCYEQSWRVSTLTQAGFANAVTTDGCSQEPLLTSQLVDASTLRFEIGDSMLSTVAACSTLSDGSQECQFVVTLIDTILWSETRQEVRLIVNRASQNTALVGLNQYIPLKNFGVEVLKAYTTEGGGIVYLVKTRLRGYTLTASMRVSGMSQLAMSEVRDCARLGISNSSVIVDTNSFSVTETETEYVTYWLGDSDLVSAYYTLDSGDGADQDIVAVRNMSGISVFCVEAVYSARFDLAYIMATSGLGADAVYQLHSVSHPTQATSGELGTLTTFIAQAYNDIPVTITLQNLLGAYMNSGSAEAFFDYNLANATALHQGNLDFTYEFRRACRTPEAHCAYEYLLPYTIHNDIHMLYNCSESQRALARGWILQQYGAMNDGGHVDAMCDRILAHPTRSSLGLLVQTQHFLDRKKWMSYMNVSMADIHALIWVNFRLTT